MRHPVRLLLIGGMLWGSGARYSAGRAQVDAPDAAPITAWSIDNSAITLRFDAADLNALATRLDMLKRGAAIQHYAIDANAQAAHVIGRLDVLLELQSRFVRVENTGDTPAAAQTRRPQTHVSPASALADGRITGVIKGDDTNAPIENANVCAYQPSPYVYECSASVASGIYTITLPAGSYTLQVYTNDYHIGEIYDNVTLPNEQFATRVTVNAGATTPNINFSLAPGVLIAGRVTDAASGLGVADVSVGASDASGYYFANATSGAGGFYTTTSGVPAGSYTVNFLPSPASGYARQWYRNADRAGASIPVVLTSGTRTNIDATLRRAAVVTGTITRPGGAPVSSSSVQIYDADGAFMDGTFSNAAGVYTLSALPAGAYKLQFNGVGSLLGEWHNNRRTREEADTLTLTAGVTTTINAELAVGASMTGRVTDRGTGAGLPGVRINLTALDGASSANAETDANGYYTATRAETGDYYVYFGANSPYLSEYFDNVVSFARFTPVSLTAGMTTTNINAALGAGAEITGIVSIPGGAPANNVYVCASAYGNLDFAQCGYTDSNGRYRVGPLTPGEYQVYADGGRQYAPQYYNNAPDTNTAQRISISGSSITNINMTLSAGALITGRVTNAANAPLADVLVQVYPRNHTSPVHYAYTGADGGYSTAPLAPGAYQIQFVSGTATQWYRAAPGQFESTVVTVTGSTTVPGVDARLGATASGTAAITGTITTSGGALLTNVGVYCQNMDTQTSVYAFATTGKFACANLTPGPYVVYAYPPAPYPTLAFYPAAGSIGGAQRITVTSGVTIPITFVLPAGGGISGRVTVGGAPKSGVSVSAIYRGADGSSATTSTSTNSAGLYSIKRRFPGPYHVSFGDGPGYAAEIYDNAATVATATTVTVASGAVTPNINADLTAGGVIKGVVTAADSGRPIPNAVIYAYTASGNSVAYFTSDADGRFVSAGLPAGEYVLLAYPGTFVAGYGAEYYNNATTLAGATRIAVGAPGSEAIANIALDGGGSISGKTIDAATGLPVGGVYVQAALSGTALYASSTSDAFGNYRVSGLRAGSYLVYYSREPFTAMYYDRKLNIEQTQPIPVTSGDVPGKTLFLVRIKLAYLPVIRR